MATEIQKMSRKLDTIKSELDYIKEHMVDADMILTEDDRKALKEANEDLGKGKTTSLKELKKEMGI